MVYLISGVNFDNTIIVKHGDYTRESVKARKASYIENRDGVVSPIEDNEHSSYHKGGKNGENRQRSVSMA